MYPKECWEYVTCWCSHRMAVFYLSGERMAKHKSEKADKVMKLAIAS